MKRLIFILLASFVSQTALSQRVDYNVVKGTKDLGDMTVIRKVEGADVFYEIESQVSFRILFSFTVDYYSESHYSYGKLIREYTHNQLNGSTQKESTIWFDGDNYTLDLDGSKSYVEEDITYSVAAIYFVEPKDQQEVYSNQFARYLKFKKVKEHSYEMLSPDGLNTYHYQNGICTQVDLNRDFARFSFVMTDESKEKIKAKSFSGNSVIVD